MAYILWTHPEINALTECSIDWGYVITFHNRINDKNGQLLATGAWQQYVVIMKGGLWLNDRSFCALSKIIQFFHVLYRPLALNLLHAVVPQPCPKSTSNRKIQHSHTQQLNGFQCRRPRKFLSKVDHNLSGVIRPNVWSVAIYWRTVNARVRCHDDQVLAWARRTNHCMKQRVAGHVLDEKTQCSRVALMMRADLHTCTQLRDVTTCRQLLVLRRRDTIKLFTELWELAARHLCYFLLLVLSLHDVCSLFWQCVCYYILLHRPQRRWAVALLECKFLDVLILP